MTMRAYKLRLYPNAEQRGALNRYFGSARWTWNRALEYRTKAYRRRRESVANKQCSRLLTTLKHTTRYRWLAAAPAAVLQQKLRDQDQAFTNFFEGRARFPRFKKRGHTETLRFTLDARHANRRRQWESGAIVVPKLGTIRYRGNNHPRTMPKMVTIRRNACGQYFASFAVEADIRPKPVTNGAVGVDLGIKHLATLSDGRKIANPKHYARRLRQLRHRQKTLSRRVKGSNRFNDARQRVARVHQRIRDSRADALHKLTTRLIGENQAVCIEDLHVRGLVRNRRLARSIADSGFGELRRQLEYKADWAGRTLIVVDRWFPSSKRCSSCGYTLDELDLSVRQWTCPRCWAAHDRDVNAAINIRNEGLKQLEPAGGRGSRVERKSADVLPRAARETCLNEARIVRNKPTSADGQAVAG